MTHEKSDLPPPSSPEPKAQPRSPRERNSFGCAPSVVLCGALLAGTGAMQLLNEKHKSEWRAAQPKDANGAFVAPDPRLEPSSYHKITGTASAAIGGAVLAAAAAIGTRRGQRFSQKVLQKTFPDGEGPHECKR